MLLLGFATWIPGLLPAQPRSSTVSGNPTLEAPPAPEPLVASGQEALRAGDPVLAAQLFQQASLRLGDAPQGAVARYLLAQALDQRGDRPGEALAAFQTFLQRDRVKAPPRLVDVAETAVARLLQTSTHWDAWSRLDTLRRALPALPYAERRDRLQRFIATPQPEEVLRAARVLLVQEARWETDWHETIRVLETLGADRAGAEMSLRMQLEQAKKELRRTRLAVLAAILCGAGLIGAGGLRPWRGWSPAQTRRAVLLVVNWAGVAWLLYGFYLLGRRSGDVSPVTLDRFLVLWVVITVATTVGLAWSLGLRERLTPFRHGLASFLAGALICCSAVYLYCFAYDYVSVLGL